MSEHTSITVDADAYARLVADRDELLEALKVLHDDVDFSRRKAREVIDHVERRTP